MGNDDYTSTKRMTGGTIPALVWHNIMAYAHQGIELRPLPGLPPPVHAPTVAAAALQGAPPPPQILLTRKATEALVRVERLLDDASHALAAQAGAASLGALDREQRENTLTAAGELKATGLSRGD
jgi:penicillin-binding protein 1A